MSRFPLWVDDWALSNLYDTVAGHKTDRTRSVDQFDVRPLVPVMMYIVGDLAEQDTLFLQHTEGFPQEGWKCMGECVLVFF